MNGPYSQGLVTFSRFLLPRYITLYRRLASVFALLSASDHTSILVQL